MEGNARPAAVAADRALERPRERAAAHGVPPVGSARNPPIDWPAIVGDVARALLGKPSSATRREFRYGRRGSLSVDVECGRWHDHEAVEGGGVLALVERERGSRAAALAWLEAEGFIGQRDPALRAAEGHSERRAVETGNPPGCEAMRSAAGKPCELPRHRRSPRMGRNPPARRHRRRGVPRRSARCRTCRRRSGASLPSGPEPSEP